MSIADLFKGKTSLDKVSLEELNRQRIKLDHEEQVSVGEIRKLEREQKELLSAGMKESSQHQKLIYARKVADKDSDIKGKEKDLRVIEHKQRIVKGLLKVRERAQKDDWQKSGVLKGMSMDQVVNWITEKTANADLKDQQLDELAGRVKASAGVNIELGDGEDENTKRVLEVMMKAGAENVPVEKVHEEVKSALRTSE